MNVNDVLTFSYTGEVQVQILKPGTYKFECLGAQGKGSSGGKGGYAVGEIEITEDTSLNIYVGQSPTTYIGGYNGGGNGSVTTNGGGGGGATDIRIGGIALANRVIVGAGGGGAGNNYGGGAGGGLTGLNAASYGGKGATQTSGGVNGGKLGIGGNSESGGSQGGGGGGYYGGGGSTSNSCGGGGGSSYYGTLTNASTTSGLRSGNGEVKITMLAGAVTAKKRRFAQII